jgi:prepilin-type N-terminal cleavage/methylation domain-containing protein
MVFKKHQKAFSLIEISVVIVIIGILIAGVSQGIDLYEDFRLNNAKTLTLNSRAGRVPDLVSWIETSMNNSFDDVEEKDGLTLSNWYDINPLITPNSKKNFTQLTSGSRPFYVKNVSNGLPAVKFESGRNLVFDGGILANTDFTMFIVERKLLNSAIWIFHPGGSCGNNQCFHSGYRENTKFTFDFYSYGIDYVSNDLAGTKTRIHTIFFSKINGQKYWLNGGKNPDYHDSAKIIPIGSATTNKIGQFYTGYIFEIIYYNRAINDNERIDIEKYLSKKYNIPII